MCQGPSLFSPLIRIERLARIAPCCLIALWGFLAPEPFAHAQGQPCSDLVAVPGEIGYQYRKAPARCEGVYQSPVMGDSLEILSFVTGSITYDLQLDKILILTAPDVSRITTAQVNVRARALPLGTYYRMDAAVTSAKSIEWPLTSVIVQTGIHSDSIGVLGWIEKDGTRIYVPFSAIPKGKPRGSSGSLAIILRSTLDIEKVQWRLWIEGRANQTPSWQTLGGVTPNAIRAGDPIRLPVDAPSQRLDLEIAAKIANSDDWLKARLPVFIP